MFYHQWRSLGVRLAGIPSPLLPFNYYASGIKFTLLCSFYSHQGIMTVEEYNQMAE